MLKALLGGCEAAAAHHLPQFVSVPSNPPDFSKDYMSPDQIPMSGGADGVGGGSCG